MDSPDRVVVPRCNNIAGQHRGSKSEAVTGCVVRGCKIDGVDPPVHRMTLMTVAFRCSSPFRECFTPMSIRDAPSSPSSVVVVGTEGGGGSALILACTCACALASVSAMAWLVWTVHPVMDKFRVAGRVGLGIYTPVTAFREIIFIGGDILIEGRQNREERSIRD